MRYIEQFREGMRVSDVYLCKTKQHAVTKNGKEYASVLLQDKTGTVDCKIWDLSSPGINDFEPLQYVYVEDLCFKNLLHFWRILLICELQFLYCSSGINTLIAAGFCFFPASFAACTASAQKVSCAQTGSLPRRLRLA